MAKPAMQLKRNPVLLVEDDEDVRDSLAFLLEDKGYAVAVAADGHEALDRLRRIGQPCLILLDLMMPRMDGWTFRRRLLSDPDYRHVPVVLMSGVMNPSHEADKIKAVAHVRKPIDLPALWRLLEEHCECPS